MADDATMIVTGVPEEARRWVRHQQLRGRRIAFVPTMGALHEGHLALVRRGRQLADAVAVSIFVNPTQFGPGEDFQQYPRCLDDDLRLLGQEGVSLVLTPARQAIYPPRFSTYVTPPAVARGFEGEHRGEHFRGVCTVVLKLFHIVPADVAVFGQKDYQQARVIIDMVEDLDLAIEIDVMPTVRQHDGLALSSRNRYLTADGRQRALGLYRALAATKDAYRGGQRDAAQLQRVMRQVLDEAGLDAIDYAEVVDPVTLQPLTELLSPPSSPDSLSNSLSNPTSKLTGSTSGGAAAAAVALIAARLAATRLIDNCLLT